MKIFTPQVIANTNFIQKGLISSKNHKEDIYADNRAVLDSLSFWGNYNTPSIKKSIDNPIKDDEEFNEVMERVYDAKTLGGNVLWISRDYRDEHKTYRHANDIEMGLLPYCGEADNSYLINVYLSGRLEDSDIKKGQGHHFPQNVDSCVDVVRALDYSLKNLDKEFGTYKGIVYRKGYMDEGNGQFYSTTSNLSSIQERWTDYTNFDANAGYSVIRLKDGHKIYEFQEKMGSTFAESEEEVVVPRQAKFKKVAPEDMDEELLKGREDLARNLFWGADKIMSGEVQIPNFFTREQLLDVINVYDEI